MSRKTKINVLLPFKMVGELENLSKLGKRSEYIEKAIRSKLDGSRVFDLSDISTRQLMAVVNNRLQEFEGQPHADILMYILTRELMS
ncbi:MAG: hypothetical protein [Circular genetic element sp.]|nr:MAG: hypothetical protein [Circular genetic element sp.]